MRNQELENNARIAAQSLREQLGINTIEVGGVLGTGWDGKLSLANPRSVPFSEVPGFSQLDTLAGHARKFVVGSCEGREVILIDGRVHVNEDFANPALLRNVRLQTEALMQLGVKRLVVTCAAGALPDSGINTGDLVVMDSFLTLFAPDMPMRAGEFSSPEDTLTEAFQNLAFENRQFYPGSLRKGCYAMVRGPFFEGRKHDKHALAMLGAQMVGMSVLPEACIASLYEGVEVLGLAFITNSYDELHSHETNRDRANENSAALGRYLSRIIQSS